MELFQILDCSTLGTCCTDYSIVGILAVTKKVFSLIQLAVPIALVVAATIQFVQLTINPELKDGFRRVLNKFIAAFIVFLLPTLMDAILTAAPDSFSVAACWKQVGSVENTSVFGNNTYIENNDNQKSVLLSPDKYYKITRSTSASNSSALRQKIVNYAMQFKGKPYAAVGCVWNGELPYRATDCIGFVKGVYSHFGITSMKKAPCGTQSLYNARNGILTQVSEKDAKPADIVLWRGHIAIYLGDGKIIHAAGRKYGVITQKLYKNGEFRGFFRVNGVE